MQSCFYYEMFMERAHGKMEPSGAASHVNLMKNLMIAEQEKIISLETVNHFEELLIEIKQHMEKAFDCYMAQPYLPGSVIDELKDYKDQVVWAVSSAELMKIVLNTIDLTLSIPIEIKC